MSAVRQFSRPEVQALVVAVTGVLAIALVPQRYAEWAGTDALGVYGIAAPLTLIFLPRFVRNALVAAGCFVGLWVILVFAAGTRGPVTGESFGAPLVMMILALPVAGGLRWLWLRRKPWRFEQRDLLRAEVQFVIALAAVATGVFIVPREAAIVVAVLFVTLFTLTAPICLIFRRTFFLNGLLTFALWLVLLVAVQPLVESRKHMREDSMVFLFPAMLILPALTVGGIAHYFVQKQGTAS